MVVWLLCDDGMLCWVYEVLVRLCGVGGVWCSWWVVGLDLCEMVECIVFLELGENVVMVGLVRFDYWFNLVLVELILLV